MIDLKAALERFETYAMPEPNSGCWLWVGPVDGRGYAKLVLGKKHYIASRLAPLLYRGEQLGPLHACHKCDVKLCVNPDHIFGGTQKENLADMMRKGRAAVGERNGMANLTDAQVRGIRFLASIGARQNKIAKQYGVSEMAISCIVRRVSWRHI